MQKLLLTILLTGLFVDPAFAEAPDAGTSRCTALPSNDFTDVQDTPPVVTGASVVQAARGVPQYCLVHGRIPVAPSLEFELRLPAAGWNGKFLAIPNIGNGNVCDGYLKRGYACAPMFRNG